MLPQALVPLPQLPTTQAVAEQTSVPVPTCGQDEASHDVLPQPKLGSFSLRPVVGARNEQSGQDVSLLLRIGLDLIWTRRY